MGGPGGPAAGSGQATEADAALQTVIDNAFKVCPKMVTAAYEAGGNNKGGALDCVYDIVMGCEADAVVDMQVDFYGLQRA